MAWSTEFLEHVGRQYMDNYMPVFQKVRGEREGGRLSGPNLLRYPPISSTPTFCPYCPLSPSTVGPGVLLELCMGGMAPRRGKRHPSLPPSFLSSFPLHPSLLPSLLSFLCITHAINTPLTAPSSLPPPPPGASRVVVEGSLPGTCVTPQSAPIAPSRPASFFQRANAPSHPPPPLQARGLVFSEDLTRVARQTASKRAQVQFQGIRHRRKQCLVVAS